MPASSTATSPTAELLQIVARARANRIMREFGKNSTAVSGRDTNSGDAPAETPAQETRHGTT